MAIDVQRALKGQYHAALAMLKQAIDKCPDTLWDGSDYPVAFWRVAYHSLFFTHFYLAPHEKAFRPWAHHRDEYQFLGPLPWPPHREPKIGDPYSKAQVLDYWQFCNEMVDQAIDSLDLASQESGFPWYKVSKLEHQLISIRHVQHHAAILAARVRLANGTGITWVGSK